ncbi:MAG: beta-ketoacyl synthase N-terminal-like domain-containing protein [Chloroflexota bacterium]
MNRVVVTGLGLVTALGSGAPLVWNRLLEGASGVGSLRGFDTSGLRSRIGAQVPPLELPPPGSARWLERMREPDRQGFVAGLQALGDAALDPRFTDGDRAGLWIACSPELALAEARAEMASEVRLPASRCLAEASGVTGPGGCFVGGAEAGAAAVAAAYRALGRGEVEVALAGGFDDPLAPYAMAKWDALGVLSESNDLGPLACRPFDRGRDGSVLGQGAAFLLLEERERARGRGARIYAEMIGVSCTYDGFGVITPDPEGMRLSSAVEGARRLGPAGPAAVLAVCHGSGTRLGDLTEARALRRVFGAHQDALTATSVKPATGHLLAAAGPLNVAVLALTLHHGVVPPTLNLRDPDPACELPVPREAMVWAGTLGIAIARGFGGENVVLALRGEPP